MANQTRRIPNLDDRYPVGTTVQLYKRDDVKDGGKTLSGTAVASATVAADGSLTFSSVPDDQGHLVMVATVNSKPVTISTGGSGVVSWGARH
jgi:hypothetical protein